MKTSILYLSDLSTLTRSPHFTIPHLGNSSGTHESQLSHAASKVSSQQSVTSKFVVTYEDGKDSRYEGIYPN